MTRVWVAGTRLGYNNTMGFDCLYTSFFLPPPPPPLLGFILRDDAGLPPFNFLPSERLGPGLADRHDWLLSGAGHKGVVML